MQDSGLWVFGYGSLIWEPAFDFAERTTARLAGWHRSFCMRSVQYRGTPDAPGLVLALDAAPGAVCHGVAFGITAEHADTALDALRKRELNTSAYIERWLPLELADERRVEAVTYVIDPRHDQYCGGMSLEDQARIIARSTGDRGANCDYLWNTAAHLAELGFADADLEWLSDRVRHLMATAS